MLIPDNVHPERTLYYNGAFVLKALQKHRVADLLDLYVEAKTQKAMSMPVFVLCLDWLFLLELVKFDTNGKVALCS